jgi:hypothetical protein
MNGKSILYEFGACGAKNYWYSFFEFYFFPTLAGKRPDPTRRTNVFSFSLNREVKTNATRLWRAKQNSMRPVKRPQAR